MRDFVAENLAHALGHLISGHYSLKPKHFPCVDWMQESSCTDNCDVSLHASFGYGCLSMTSTMTSACHFLLRVKTVLSR